MTRLSSVVALGTEEDGVGEGGRGILLGEGGRGRLEILRGIRVGEGGRVD